MKSCLDLITGLLMCILTVSIFTLSLKGNIDISTFFVGLFLWMSILFTAAVYDHQNLG